MVSRRAYRRVSVNEIDREQLLELAKEHGNPGTVLGLDIARNEIVACLRWKQDHFERPWKIIKEQVASDPVMQRYSDAVGAATLAVLWSDVGDPVAYSSEHRKMKGLIAMMRKLCKSLWHARVHNKDFDYSLVINGVPPRRRRRRRKTAKKAA